MSTPDPMRRPELRRDGRRVASGASQMWITGNAASTHAENVVRLVGTHPDRVADRWRSETRFESLRGRAFAHPSFADFAALGDGAITVALKRLDNADEADLWLDVLHEIADGPQSTDGKLDDLIDAWRRWARERDRDV